MNFSAVIKRLEAWGLGLEVKKIYSFLSLTVSSLRSQTYIKETAINRLTPPDILKYLFFFASLSFLFTSLSFAQQAPEPVPSKNIPVLREIQVREKPSESSATGETAFGEKIDTAKKNKKEIAENISLVPGVQMRKSGGTGQRTSISLRGTDSQQTLVLLEGIPLNSPLGGGVDFSMLPQNAISTAEVLRGGQSVLFGSDAIGGVVNLGLKPYTGKNSFEFDFLYGSFDTFSSGFNGSAGNESGHLLLSFLMDYSSGKFPYIDDNKRHRIREHNASNSTNVVLKGGLNLNSSSSIDVIMNFFDSDREIPGFSQFPSETATQNDAKNILGIKYSFRMKKEPVLGNVMLFAKYTRFNYKDPSPPMPPAVDSRSSLVTPGLKSEIKWLVSDSFTIISSGFVQEDYAELAKLNTATRYPDRISYHLSLSAASSMLSEKFLIKPSLSLSGAQGFYPAIIPRFGLLIAPVSWFFIKGNLARSFRYPTFEELYFDGGFIQGNPDLKPEDSWGYDAGFGFDFKFLKLSLSYFDFSISNLIVFNLKSPFFTQAENTRNARTRGIETSAQMKISEILSMQAAYTYTNPYSEASNLRLPGRSLHTLSVNISSGFKPFSLYFEALGQSRFYLDRFENVSEEGRIFLNAGINYSPFEWLEGYVHLKNLLNKKDAVDYLQYPLPGFSMAGGVKMKL
jgi:outer membrane cobalamin receptor